MKISKKITIGLFSDSFYPMSDGVINVVDNYAKRLIKYANVIVFAPEDPENEFDDSIFPYKVVRCKAKTIPYFDYVLPTPKLDENFKKELEKSKLDIVHIHSPFAIGKAGIKYAKKNNIPCIATMHSQFKRDILKVVKNELIATKINDQLIKVFNQCDECRAVNGEVARIFYEDYGYKMLPKVLNNATDIKPIRNKKIADEYINLKYNIKPEEKVFLFVGRLNTLKNILFIVDSLKEVRKKAPNLKFKMLFVGTGADEDKLVNQIKNNNLKKYVLLCGKITDRKELAYHYSRADLFLFPSVYDASSIVQIEAASQKTPTIFLKDTATASTVTDNINGFLSNYSEDAYSNKIIEVLDNNKLYKNVSNKAYKDLYKNWDDSIKEIYELYLNIIETYKKK